MDKTKVDVQTASRILGISPDAVRKRIERKTLDAVRENGVWMVFVDDAKHDNRPDNDQKTTGQDTTSVQVIEALKGHIESLKVEGARQQRTINELQRERERTSYILALREQRILELEAPKTSRTLWGRLFGKQ